MSISPNYKLENARLQKSNNALKRKIAANKRKINQLEKKYHQSKIENFFKPERSNSFINEISSNAQLPGNRRRYSKTMMCFAMTLITISLSCYDLLRSKFVGMPSRQAVESFFREDFYFKNGVISDLSQIDDAIDYYRKNEDENLKNETDIHCILAVDAISLTPEIMISKKGFVYGTVKPEKINKSQVDNLLYSMKKYEAFVQSKKM